MCIRDRVPSFDFSCYLISQSQMKLTLNRNRHDPQFVRQYFSSRAGQKAILSSAIQTGVPHTNLGILRAYRFPAPKLDEQREIANALSDVDALIDGLDRLIAKKRNLKRAAMQQLLTGQVRLPGFGGDWESKRLGECLLAKPDYGINAPAVPFSDSLPTYIRITDITEDGRFSPSPRVSVQSPLAVNYQLAEGDVVFARTGASVGKAYRYRPTDGPLVFAGFLIRVRPDPNLLVSEYLVAYAAMDAYRSWVTVMSMRSGQPGINGGEYAQLELHLPPTEEQLAIVTVLSDMDAEVAAFEVRRAKTRDLKQAMMQELLTGRIRLVQPQSMSEVESRTGGRNANLPFRRSVLAAEIVDQLHEQSTFGHVKLEKLIFLTEHLCRIDTGSSYHRHAAGPYDNRALRSIDSQLKKQKWFDAQKIGGRYQYVPLEKRGGHKKYFDSYFLSARPVFDRIIGTFRTLKTEQCEIVATLFSAWIDLIRQHGAASDDAIVREVLTNWHESKTRIAEDRWRTALEWIRANGFMPDGADSV